RSSPRRAAPRRAAAGLLQYGFERPAHLGRIARGLDAALLHHGELLLGSPLAPRNDRPGVAHALARRRGDASDEADHGLTHVLLHPACCGLFIIAADLAHHDHRFGLRVIVEHLKNVYVLQPVDRIAADADAARLAEPELAELAHRFVSERPGPGDDAPRSFFVDVARHDADLELIGRDHARAVGPDQQRPFAFHAVARANHVPDGDAFGDADDEVESRIDRLVDRRG